MAKMIDKPVDERRFRADHRQIDFIVFAQRQKGADIIGLDRNAFGILSDARIAGRAPESFRPAGCAQRMDDGVLAAAAADDQDFQFFLLF